MNVGCWLLAVVVWQWNNVSSICLALAGWHAQYISDIACTQCESMFPYDLQLLVSYVYQWEYSWPVSRPFASPYLSWTKFMTVSTDMGNGELWFWLQLCHVSRSLLSESIYQIPLHFVQNEQIISVNLVYVLALLFLLVYTEHAIRIFWQLLFVCLTAGRYYGC